MKALVARVKCWRHGHDWTLEHGFIGWLSAHCLQQLRGKPVIDQVKTYARPSDRGVEIYGWRCRKCGARKPASEADAMAVKS